MPHDSLLAYSHSSISQAACDCSERTISRSFNLGRARALRKRGRPVLATRDGGFEWNRRSNLRTLRGSRPDFQCSSDHAQALLHTPNTQTNGCRSVCEIEPRTVIRERQADCVGVCCQSHLGSGSAAVLFHIAEAFLNPVKSSPSTRIMRLFIHLYLLRAFGIECGLIRRFLWANMANSRIPKLSRAMVIQ